MDGALMALRQKDADATIRYLVSQDKGEFVIEIPANWKVTFGAVNPGSADGMRRDLHCMRVYEGEKVRAVYCDVRGFRDLSIPMARKVQSETRASTWSQDSTGNFKGTTERQLGEASFVPEADVVDLDFGEKAPF
jgi:hypothetical protein